MRKRDGWFFIVCVVLLIVLVFLAPKYGWQIRAWLGPQAAPLNNSAGLAAENESLAAQLAVLQGVAAQLPAASMGGTRAIVYSRYPLNFKNEILVNVGAQEGAVAGKAVTFQGIFIGSVEKTFPDTSLVRTVFDGTFKMPVRIGSAGYDALFVGGAAPHVTSIAKSAAVHPGDIVYTAAEGMPYGLPVAIVQSTSTSPDELFQEATLGFAYDVNTIQAVVLLP